MTILWEDTFQKEKVTIMLQLVRLMKRIRDNLDTLMPGSADRAGEPAARRSRGRHDATRA